MARASPQLWAGLQTPERSNTQLHKAAAVILRAVPWLLWRRAQELCATDAAPQQPARPACAQASWVKMGPERAARLLACGANDMGGSLMNESITRAAGAPEHVLPLYKGWVLPLRAAESPSCSHTCPALPGWPACVASISNSQEGMCGPVLKISLQLP